VLRRLLDSPTTWFALAGLLFLALVVTQVEIELPPRPRGEVADLRRLAERDDLSVLFVVVDTLRGDRLHAYGYPRQTSPTLDYLAATGIRFEHVVAQSSWTKTSMASLWTSTWPRRHGVLRYNQAVPEAARMPAELLRDAGFRTAGLWRNGWVAPNFGFQQGFTTYVKPVPSATPERFQRKTPSTQWVLGTDEDVTEAAREFLRSFGRQRFFLYLHYMDVHQYAYDEASAKFGTGYSDTYDNAIHWVDRNLGAVVQELAELELWKKTIVVVVSDHGEGFREHGLEGHARTLYREVVDVPWIVALPFTLEPGVVVRETVGNVDVWPTLYDLLGVAAPDGLDGRSALPLIEAAARGEPPSGAASSYYAQLDRSWGRPSQAPSPFVRVVSGPWRRIEPILDPGVRPAPELRLELFDARSDRDEQSNLAGVPGAALPPETDEALARYLAEQVPPWGAAPDEVTLQEMELNQLRALGYVIQ
jgi:arylsulfatase A-like enzyme